MRPLVDKNLESNIPGLYLAGSIVEASGIRVSANQGHGIASRIAAITKQRGPTPEGIKDLIIAGAGPAGLNAAITAKELGLEVLIFDQYFMGSTLLGMPEGKIFDVHYKGNRDPPEGSLWYETSPSPALHSKWRSQIKLLKVRLQEHSEVKDVKKDPNTGIFEVSVSTGVHRTMSVLIAIGKAGHPRHLNVIGEFGLKREHKLHYKYRGRPGEKGKKVMVVGGGNTAAEATIGLAKNHHVTLAYRKDSFTRITEKNHGVLHALEADGTLDVLRNANILRFEDASVVLLHEGRVKTMKFDDYYILIGFEIPYEFLKRIGVEVR